MRLHQFFYLGVFLITVMTVLILGTSVKKSVSRGSSPAQSAAWWKFQSIDTMKFSRDPSRQYLNDLKTLQTVSDQQLKSISQTGATYVAIGTPYDEEFLPVLTTWVAAARKYHLHVWFRGNWSGWEGWFGYSKISRDEHAQKTQKFISSNPNLFEDGDIFSACPECENGGPGDPRQTGDVQGHRDFLISEYNMMSTSFKNIGKNVQVNYNSMNKDVADVVMDKDTTAALGGLVVIDHYVKTPEQLNEDITKVAENSGGNVILGEFGAPIPDIHGDMSEQEQAQWLANSLNLLSENSHLVGLNYWTDMGGSTAIWDDKGQAKLAVSILHEYYTPKVVQGKVSDTLGNPLDQVSFVTDRATILSDRGFYQIPYLHTESAVSIASPEFHNQKTTVAALIEHSEVNLSPLVPDAWYRFWTWFNHLFQ